MTRRLKDALDVASTSQAGTMSAADKTKLDGIATAATANSSDATLLARANHTGSQAISTVTGLQTALDAKATAYARGRSRTGGVSNLHIPGVQLVFATTASPPITTFGLTANFFHYMPIEVDTSITLDRLYAEITSAASAGNTMRMGIYNCDTDLQPTSLVVDGGTVAIDATSAVSSTINQVLTPGRYLLASLPQANCTVRCVFGWLPSLGFAPGLGGTSIVGELYASQAYGALPATGPAWSQVTANAGMAYHVWTRISTP
jgi:hypothetical protein